MAFLFLVGVLIPLLDLRPMVMDRSRTSVDWGTNFVNLSWEKDLASCSIKNIDSLFRKRMEKILWFLFLLFREAAEEITALGGKLGWVRSKGLSALEIRGVCECVYFWLLTVERRPYLSIQGRRIYRIEAGEIPSGFQNKNQKALCSVLHWGLAGCHLLLGTA